MEFGPKIVGHTDRIGADAAIGRSAGLLFSEQQGAGMPDTDGGGGRYREEGPARLPF